jgi:hypothetical protein
MRAAAGDNRSSRDGAQCTNWQPPPDAAQQQLFGISRKKVSHTRARAAYPAMPPSPVSFARNWLAAYNST